MPLTCESLALSTLIHSLKVVLLRGLLPTQSVALPF
jgi:hypothetical protein